MFGQRVSNDREDTYSIHACRAGKLRSFRWLCFCGSTGSRSGGWRVFRCGKRKAAVSLSMKAYISTIGTYRRSYELLRQKAAIGLTGRPISSPMTVDENDAARNLG